MLREKNIKIDLEKKQENRFKNCINHNPFIYFNKSRFPIILWNFEGKNKT